MMIGATTPHPTIEEPHAMATDLQIAANRTNAAKSTGPRTAAGKDASRRNALTHGLSGAGLVLTVAEQAAVAERLAAWSPSYGDLPPHRRWALAEMVRESVRIDRCDEEEAALRARAAERAGSSWDDDRDLAAEELGLRLGRKPSLVLLRLSATPQGCAWLLGRWEGLAAVLGAGGDWDESQVRLAQDLLGVNPLFRDLPGMLEPDGGDSDPDAVRACRLAVAVGEAGRLRDRIEGPASASDDLDRGLALRGIEVDPDPGLARLRRYSAGCHRRLSAAWKLLEPDRKSAGAAPGPAPVSACPAVPPASEVVGHVEEVDEPADLPEPVSALPSRPAPDRAVRPMNRGQRRAEIKRQRSDRPR